MSGELVPKIPHSEASSRGLPACSEQSAAEPIARESFPMIVNRAGARTEEISEKSPSGKSSRDDPSRIVREYERDGFVIMRRFWEPAVMKSLDGEANELWADQPRRISPRNLRCRYMGHHATGERLFECFDPVLDIAPAMASVATDPRLMQLLSYLYDQPAHLFKDKLIFKPPGALGYPLHQDYIAWPEFPRSFLTVVIPLDAANEENGCTVVYAGVHQQGLLTPADGHFHVVPCELVHHAPRVALVLEPGDLAVFNGLVPHESQPNRTMQARRQLYLSYNAHSDGGDQREKHYQQFHLWLREKYPRSAEEAWYFA